MERQPHTPQGGDFQNPWQGVNPYGTDDPHVQARIEQARTEAAEERRRNRTQLEGYVNAGLDPDDAEALVEFEQSAADTEPPAVEPDRLTDDQLIHLHITEALREVRPIDHATARAIAAQLHGGQASALYALASSGAVVDDVRSELDAWREDNATGVEVEPWLDALDEYLGSRDDPSPIEGWSGWWPAPPRAPEVPDEPEHDPGTVACEIGHQAVSATVDVETTADEEEAARAALMGRLNAAADTTLGQVATVIGGTVEHPYDDQEHDNFAWADAAHWSPAEVALADYQDRPFPAAELDALFAETPDEQVGSVDELGWYGLVKHDGRPGGLILAADEHGARHVREAATDEALHAQWAAVQQEYETFYEQRDAYELATEEAISTPSGLNPRIWAGSLADYNSGRLHGVWLDSTLDPDELHQAIQFMLRNGYTPGAEEWGIFDYDEFGGYEVGEYANLKTISHIAQGIAQHGPVYAAWVDLVGDHSNELLTDEAFHDHFEGEYDSLEGYVEYILDETGFTTELDRALVTLPEDLRRHVQVDVEGIGEEWGQGLHVVESRDGKVWVFDARA